MFIAMNRFRIASGREQDFESIWRNRQSYLEEVLGFIEFHLLRGPSENRAVLYASHWYGKAGRRSKTGPTPNRFERRTARPELPREHTSGRHSSTGFDVVL
jgi:antibiotic biosynthesis monooxygenase